MVPRIIVGNATERMVKTAEAPDEATYMLEVAGVDGMGQATWNARVIVSESDDGTTDELLFRAARLLDELVGE